MRNITIHPDHTDKYADPQYINMSDLGEEEQAVWQRSKGSLKQHISNYVQILVYDARPQPGTSFRHRPISMRAVHKSAVEPNSLASRGPPG